MSDERLTALAAALRPVDRAVIRSISDVWETAQEVRVNVWQNYRSMPWQASAIDGALRHLRALGLVDYRPPGGGYGVLPVGEWAITEDGDVVAAAAVGPGDRSTPTPDQQRLVAAWVAEQRAQRRAEWAAVAQRRLAEDIYDIDHMSEDDD